MIQNLTQNQDLKLDIVANMEKYGGSFVRCLAKLIVLADGENLQKIENTWPEYIRVYSPSNKGGM